MENVFQHSITAFLSSLVVWLFSRRKNLAEDRGKELDNAIKAVKYYRELLDDMAKRVAETTDTVMKLESNNRELMLTNQSLAKNLESATKSLMQLEEKHSELMRINQSLVSELQKYKQLNGKTL